MNLVDAVVEKILGDPYEAYGKWWVKVSYNSWGCISETELMLNSLEDAHDVKPGYRFLT